MPRTPHFIRSLAAALVASSALLVAAATARADVPDTWPACPAPVAESPFEGDAAKYVLTPGGSFECDPISWTSGGATIVADNARAGAGQYALQLGPGSSATSREMSVGLNYPTLRLFAKTTDPSSRLTVQVLFKTPDGVRRQLKIADLSAGGAWQPTRSVRILANLLALFPSWDGQVAFRFTPTGGGTWTIDDVYVDPYER